MQAEDIAQLERLILHGWQPVCAAGWHDCSLCGRKPTDGPLMRPIAGEPTMIGAANLFVPASDVLYVAPSLVIHYVEDHGYLPPEEFLVALRAVEPTSARYRQACRRLWGS